MRPLFILLYPLSAKWVTRDNNIIYPLETSFPEINLIIRATQQKFSLRWIADIIVPSYDFPDKIHNEDSYYSRLAIGFFHGEIERQIPLNFNNPELEAILFPDLFPDRGFYGDICNRSNSSAKHMKYGKYIKSQLMGYDSRFRLHPV